jgi:hypothetical protein
VTKYQISAINSCWEKCDEKCAYMFNVYKDQLSRQTGSRNLTGPKMLPTIWYTYMMLVTKYQISAQASYIYIYIGTPYRGKRFWTHRIPTSCLPTLLIFIHIEHICSFFVVFFSATIYGRNLIFGHKLHIGTPYRGKPFLTRLISTSLRHYNPSNIKDNFMSPFSF